MAQLLFWTYLTNLVLLICHEIDSAYWKEWTLFGIKGKEAIQGFVLAHIPIFFIMILGLFWIKELQTAGIVLSGILAFSGLFAFIFHFYHIRKGKPEFGNITSKVLLIAIFIISLTQSYLTIYHF